jgi:hypothetical protein
VTVKWAISDWSHDIERVEIERETGQCIYRRVDTWDGRSRLLRERKTTARRRHYDSWQEALDALVAIVRDRLSNLEATASRERERLQRLESLVDPTAK